MSKRKPFKSDSADISDNDGSKPSVSKSEPKQDLGQTKISSGSTLVLTVTLALLLATGSYFYSSFSGSSGKAPAFLTRLPESYALCTHEPGKVYTVTGKDGNGTADCLLVRKDRILGTGTIGR